MESFPNAQTFVKTYKIRSHYTNVLIEARDAHQHYRFYADKDSNHTNQYLILGPFKNITYIYTQRD